MHSCHHPHCNKHIKPNLVACAKEWFQLPKKLRDKIWETYVPGQEEFKNPTREYLKALYECLQWWHDHDLANCKPTICLVANGFIERHKIESDI